MATVFKTTLLSLFILFSAAACSKSAEPTKASQSSYVQDYSKATTSSGLSKADFAWHAQNTFGWDCSEVVARGENGSENYIVIECSSGQKIRVYPRNGILPRITNENDTFDLEAKGPS